MAVLDDYNTAVNAFVASPSAATALALEGAFVKLPRAVAGDGTSVSFGSLVELRDWTREKIAASRAESDTRRVITARTNFGGLR